MLCCVMDVLMLVLMFVLMLCDGCAFAFYIYHTKDNTLKLKPISFAIIIQQSLTNSEF